MHCGDSTREAVEDVWQLLGRDADTVVMDDEPRRWSDSFDGDLDRLSGSELGRVRK
jgi:hypothetical protein